MNGRLERGVASLHPAYFALVMATGIVSIACHLLGIPVLDRALLWLNSVFFVVLWALTLTRVFLFPDRVAADLAHHARAVGFFTTVAGTCVTGTQWLIVAGNRSVAVYLWIAGIALWGAITYGVFTILTVLREKPPLADGINGGWLVSVVAAQSVSVLGSQLASGFGTAAPAVLFFSLAMWLGGGMLYIWIISLSFTDTHSSRWSPRTSRRHTGSTWDRSRSRRWRARCSSRARRRARSFANCCRL